MTVVVGARGDLAALQNNKVLAAILGSIVVKNDRMAQEVERWGEPAGRAADGSRKQTLLEKVQAATLQSVSNEAGFAAHTVDTTLRGCVKSDDPETKKLGQAYIQYYPTFPKEPNYEWADQP